jgi:hypothetical protein
MIRTTVALIVVLALAMSASAYDFLYSGDTAMTPDAGSFGVVGGFQYLMADEYYDFEGESQEIGADWTAIWIPIHAYYGVMDNMALGVNAKFGMPKLSADDDEIEGSGIGDTWLWAKYMFMPDPMMTVRLGVNLPTGGEPEGMGLFPVGFYGVDEDGDISTGAGYTSIDGALMFGLPAGPGTLEGAAGYRYNLAREIEVSRATYDYTHGGHLHFALSYMYYINDMMGLSLGADGFFGSDDKVDLGDEARDSETVDDTAANAIYINPAFHYKMDNGMTLGVDMTYPLTGQNVPAEWGFGAYVGWGM